MIAIVFTFMFQSFFTDSIVYHAGNKPRIGDVPQEFVLKIKGDTLYFDNAKYFIADWYNVDFDPVSGKFDQRYRCLTENDKIVIFHIWRKEKQLYVLFTNYIWRYYVEKNYKRDE